MAGLDQKATEVFAGKVVRKDLVRKVKVGANIPVYVLEYLIGKYCATDDPAAIDAGLRLVNFTVAENFIRPDEANRAQFTLKDKGRATFTDKVRVHALESKDWAELANFGNRYLHIPDYLIRQSPRLLPMVERNYNFIELGPRGTGKSFVVALYSLLKNRSALPGLVVTGQLTLQGYVSAVSPLVEALQVAMDNGARRVLLPVESKPQFLEVSAAIIERVDPIFFSDPLSAAIKALGIN